MGADNGPNQLDGKTRKPIFTYTLIQLFPNNVVLFTKSFSNLMFFKFNHTNILYFFKYHRVQSILFISQSLKLMTFVSARSEAADQRQVANEWRQRQQLAMEKAGNGNVHDQKLIGRVGI